MNQMAQMLGAIYAHGSAFFGADSYGGGLDYSGWWRSRKHRARNRKRNRIAAKSRARNRK